MSASYRKSRSANTMVPSDFWSKVEIWPFRACTMKKYAIWPLLVAKCQNSFILWEIKVGEHDGNVRFLTGSRNVGVSCVRNDKICNLTLVYGRVAKIPASCRKLGSANTTLMSDCWPEVEIWPFRACAITKYAIWPLFMAELPKFRNLIANLGQATRWWRQIFDRN